VRSVFRETDTGLLLFGVGLNSSYRNWDIVRNPCPFAPNWGLEAMAGVVMSTLHSSA
jgi:hypothetical protein